MIVRQNFADEAIDGYSVTINWLLNVKANLLNEETPLEYLEAELILFCYGGLDES